MGVVCFKGLKISMVFGILILRVGPALLLNIWKRVKSLQSNDNDLLQGGTQVSKTCTLVQIEFNYSRDEMEFKNTNPVTTNGHQIDFTVIVLLCVEY